MVQAEFSPVNCPLVPPATVNCPCHLRNSNFLSRERGMFMYFLPPSPPFTDKVFSEERQLMKWVGIFQVGIFWVGIFLEPIKVI